MQIMFGRVHEDDLDENNFIVSENEQYYYLIDSNEESFSIVDTCSRSVIVSLDNLVDLKNALDLLHIKAQPMLDYNEAKQELVSEKVYTV